MGAKPVVATALPSAPAVQPAPSTFKGFWNLGYHRLVPVIPPTAEISERSSLLKRKDARGKAVGIRGPDGLWHGIDWLARDADEFDLQRYAVMGAGVGIKCGHGLVVIDADTMSEQHAKTIKDIVEKHCGRIPVKVGQYPKASYFCRVSAPMKYTRVEFSDNNERVEILSDGRQAVVHGVHPKTLQPYTWPRPLIPFDDLPVYAPASILHMLEEMRAALPASKPLITEGSDASSEHVNQEALRGDAALVRKAVAAIPNTSEHFPARENYLAIGYAIRAALPDDPAEAFDVFSEWCERWEDPPTPEGNRPEIIAADFKRMKPPYRRGAGWLYELAEQYSGGTFSAAEKWFEPVQASEANSAVLVIEPTPYAFPDPAGIPPRQWVYGDHYIRGFVSATVAPGGLGKSSLTIAEALAMASGKPLLGVTPCGQFRVWLWNGEDPRDELDRRIAAAMQHYSLTAADVGDRLLVDSGMEQEITLARQARSGATIVEPMANALASALQRTQIDVFVADPFVSSHQVTENDNVSIDLVVKRWGKIAFNTGTSIELVHHVRKTNGAEVTVEDARGASALVNGTRVTRALTRMTEAEGRSLGVAEHWRYFRTGGVAKSNLTLAAGAPAEKADWFTMRSEQLANGPGQGAEALMAGDAVGVVIRASLSTMAVAHDPGEVEEAFRLIRAGNWRTDVRAGDAWVGRAVAQAFGLDAADNGDKTKINGILRQWRHERLIHDELRPDKSRHNRLFVRVTSAAVETPSIQLEPSVFA